MKTAREAYDETTKILKAYSEGDLLGGNPMRPIEDYANEKVKATINHFQGMNDEMTTVCFDNQKQDQRIKELEEELRQTDRALKELMDKI